MVVAGISWRINGMMEMTLRIRAIVVIVIVAVTGIYFFVEHVVGFRYYKTCCSQSQSQHHFVICYAVANPF